MTEELDLLIERYLSGAATEEETRRLEELLKADRQAMRAFLLALDEDVSLRKLLSYGGARKAASPEEGESLAGPEPAARRVLPRPLAHPARNLWTPLLVGGGLLAACFLLLSLLSSEPSGRGDRARSQSQRPARGTEQPPPEIQRTEPDRRRAEERLVEIDRERRALVETPPRAGAKPDPEKEGAQRRRLAELDEERRRIEEEMRRAVDAARKPHETPPQGPENAPENKPRETVPGAPTRAEAAAATLDRAEGAVWVIAGAEKSAAGAGGRVLAGQGVETVGPRSSAALTFQDGTRVEIAGDSQIREVVEGDGRKGKRLVLAQGTVFARVPRQPMGLPMVLSTPHGEAKVLGTLLRLVVEAGEKGSTRLEVTEGKVQLRRSDGKAVEVTAGHFAVAAAGAEFVSRPLPLDEIFLLPEQAQVAGTEWRAVRDPNTASGLALEALETSYKIRTSGGQFVYPSVRNRAAALFSFTADAGRDYHVWIRGRTLATADRRRHDEVAIEAPNGQLSQRCRQLGYTGDNAFCYTGYCLFPGYAWIGGYGEDGTSDTVPLSIRFNRAGMQTLKLYAIETPMRIDAIWLSATQATRPPADQRLPIREGK